jgi:histidinol-phosphate aminotransferase
MADNIFEIARPGVQSLRPYEPGKPIEDLEREYGIQNAVKLASNENPLGPSPEALDAVSAAARQLARYPDGNGFRLKEAIAAHHGIGADQITLGNGSNEILELVVRAFVEPDDEVIFSQHAFAVYPIVTQAAGARGIEVPAREWGHDLDVMLSAVTERTRVVFVANPNNPTGTWVSVDALESFVQELPDHVVCVVDEAYSEYVEEADYPDTTQWVGRYDRLVATRTFSKIFGLAGLRAGYGVSSPALADLLNRVRQPFNMNSLALAGAEAALGDQQHIERSVENNRKGMAQLCNAFGEMGLEYVPSVGNFVAVDVGQSGQKLYEDLLRRGVIVRPIGGYGMPNHLRVTVGTPEENERFLHALRDVLAESE